MDENKSPTGKEEKGESKIGAVLWLGGWVCESVCVILCECVCVCENDYELTVRAEMRRGVMIYHLIGREEE